MSGHPNFDHPPTRRPRHAPPRRPPAGDPARPSRPPPDAPFEASPCAGHADIAWMMGVTAGCARGLLAGRRRALEAVLGARFGPLDTAARARVRALEPGALDRRLRDAVRVADLDAFWEAADVEQALRRRGVRG